MKYYLFSVCLVCFSVLQAQNSIVHTIEINPKTKLIQEKIVITTSKEYLLKVPKERDVKGKTVSISPKNYRRIYGDKHDLLLFNSPLIEVIYTEDLSDNQFVVTENGVYTVSVDFNYNYLSGSDKFDYDSTTNNTISSFVEIDGDYEIVNYRFDPDIGGKNLDGNKIEFKGNVNKMHIEIDYAPKKELKIQSEKTNPVNLVKEVVVQKEINFKGTLTLSLWDDAQDDGDIVSLWLGDVCLAKNLKVSKEKVQYKITKEMFGSANSINIRIDNVDEGTIPPNTVLIELRGDGVNENLRISTSNNVSKEIVLKK